MVLLEIHQAREVMSGKQNKIKEGDCVALLIRDRQGRVLIVQENHVNEEHATSAGIWSIVTETCDLEFDSCIHDTVVAGLTEEVFHIANFQLIDGSYEAKQLSTNGFGTTYTRHGSVLLYSGEEEDFYPIDPTEIAAYKWVTVDELKCLHEQGVLDEDVLEFVYNYQDAGFLEPN